MPLKTLKPIRAFGNKGQDVLPEKLLVTLMEDLASVGDFFNQRVKLHAHGRLHSEIYSLPVGKQAAVIKVLANLDFTTFNNKITGTVGGARQETNRKATVVTYCGYSGVVVISTNLTSSKFEVLDV